MNDIRMWWFHVAQFARNGYFVQLLVTTTLGMVILQALAARSPDAAPSDVSQGWLRAGMLGTWTVCAVSSGMLGYQRYQGTLVHLMRSPFAALRALLPVVGAASVFGLLALPLAALGSWALRQPTQVGPIWSMLVAGAVFWAACLAISALIGLLFVLTPNAITYEGVLGVPLVLASGVFGTPSAIPAAVAAATRILPTRSAVEQLQHVGAGAPISGALLAQTLVTTAFWLGAVALAARVVARRALAAGTLEVV